MPFESFAIVFRSRKWTNTINSTTKPYYSIQPRLFSFRYVPILYFIPFGIDFFFYIEPICALHLPRLLAVHFSVVNICRLLSCCGCCCICHLIYAAISNVEKAKWRLEELGVKTLRNRKPHRSKRTNNISMEIFSWVFEINCECYSFSQMQRYYGSGMIS